MVVPHLTQAELFQWLSENGFKNVSSEFWNDHDRVIFEKGEINFPVQTLGHYNFPIVMKYAEHLNIEPPAHISEANRNFIANRGSSPSIRKPLEKRRDAPDQE